MKLLKEVNEDKGDQMSLLSDTAEVIKFLEFISEKSILNPHAVTCRITACNNLFSILDQGEDEIEYILENLDVLTNRFRNKNTSVRPSTLKVYKSRVKSSLEDYQAWCKDPLGWEKSVNEKGKTAPVKESRKNHLGKNGKNGSGKAEPTEVISPEALEMRSAHRAPRKLAFPLRPDCNVEILLPADGLTLKELLRLGLFLYPYCKDTEQFKPRWSN